MNRLSLALVLALLLPALPARAADTAVCPAIAEGAAQWAYPSEPFASGAPTLRYTPGAGWLAYWYGPPAANGAKTLSFSFLTASAARAFDFSALAADIAASGVTAAARVRTTLSANDPAARAIWCPFWAEMVAGQNIPAPAPPAPASSYVVAKSGTATSRPAYSLADGVLGTKEVARAPVGMACICSSPGQSFMKGATLYCPYQGGPSYSVVAVCGKA